METQARINRIALESDLKARKEYMIFNADELIAKYDYSQVYSLSLDESVEAINCRVERIASMVSI